MSGRQERATIPRIRAGRTGTVTLPPGHRRHIKDQKNQAPEQAARDIPQKMISGEKPCKNDPEGNKDTENGDPPTPDGYCNISV